MDYKDIYKVDLNGAFLFYGDEKLLIENACEYIEKKFIAPGMDTFNLANYEGKDLSQKDLISSCETLPIMNEKRVILVKNASAFSENINDKFFDSLDKLGDFVILIFIDMESKINKTKKFYKYFKKKKRNIEFPKLKGRDIYRFAEGYIARKNKKIRNTDLSFLISKSSYNSRNAEVSLYDLKNEMDKIISLSNGEYIEKNTIEASMTENTDTNIFMFLDYLCEKNTEGALKEFRNLHFLNEPLPKILVMFTRSVRNLINYKALSDAHYRDAEIMQEMGIKSFEYKKVARFSKNFDYKFLCDFYKKLMLMDEKIKTSSGHDLILFEMLIVEFTGKK